MKMSPSFKVGILTLVALIILLFTVLWIKGRSFSSAERIEVHFKDVNGMRPGSGVQMMGLRVGQVEEIIPVVDGESSYVKMKFVITEPGITIPKASMLSIQQSGLIGEQFLEITPPRVRSVYIPVVGKELLSNDAPVEIKLDDKYYDVGNVKKSQIMTAKLVPDELKDYIKTNYAYKVDYVVNLPGLIIPHFMTGKIVTEDGVKKLRIAPLDNAPLPYPQQTSPYTIIEPMRIADFMDLQYKAAESLTETNRIINELLNDSMIAEIRQSVTNFKDLTAQATTTLAKTEKLIMPIVEANNVELFDVDYIKEGQDWYLRVYIDKEGGVTIDDCQAVSRAFNEILDKENYITDQYIFEVSSPGLTRPLKKEKDYAKSIGKLIDIKLYKAVEGLKEYTGVLKEYDKDNITIEVDDNLIKIERSNLAMIRWAYVE